MLRSLTVIIVKITVVTTSHPNVGEV